MLQPTIDQYSALKRFYTMVTTLNEAQPVKSFERTYPDGRVQTIMRQKPAINSNELATGERLIKDYIGCYLTLYRQQGPAAFEDGHPPLRTNSKKIGRRRCFSDRTARNHMRKLQQYGLVTGYKWRGTSHDFEVWISPAILWSNPDFAVENLPKPAQQIPQETVLNGSIGKNFPHRVIATQSYLETEIGESGLLIEHGNENHGNPNRPDPETAEKAPTRAPDAQGNPNRGGGGAAAENRPASAGERLRAKFEGRKLGQIQLPVEAERLAKQRQFRLETFVASFWAVAKTKLYAGRQFAPHEEAAALKTIRFGVYRNFQIEVPDAKWDRVQTAFLRRIEMVEKYINRHPDRYLPEPFAVYREGTGYFDHENIRGFRGTEKWLDDTQRFHRRSYVSSEVSKAIRKLTNHRLGQPDAKLAKKTYIDAYRTLEQSLARFGDEALDKFRTQASAIGKAKSTVTAGFTKVYKH